MNVQKLFDLLLSCGPLPDEFSDKNFIEQIKDYITPFLHVTLYEREQVILSAGHRADHIYFLEKGLAYGYYLDSNTGGEVVHFIWSANSIITDPQSFFFRSPSRLFINAAAGTTLQSISYYDMVNCFEIFPDTEIFARNVILLYHSYEYKRSFENRNVTTRHRYLKLLKNHPYVEQLLSQKMIASYLNVTPQSLSRLKKNLRGK